MESNYFYNVNSFNDYSKIYESHLTILSFNIRSISSISKFNQFRFELTKFNKIPDIIAIQETWFSENLINLYSIPGYNSAHSCRQDGYGGTSIYIRSELNFFIKETSNKDFIDCVSICLPNIRLNNKPLVLSSIYRSQKCTYDKFFDFIENALLSCGDTSCLFLGDFNIDTLNPSVNRSSMFDIFAQFDMYSSHSLITRPQSKTSIDCVFKNFTEEIYVHAVESKLSDHNMILCCVKQCSIRKPLETQKTRLINFTILPSSLNTNLINIDMSATSSQLCEEFIKKTQESVEACTTTITNNIINTNEKLTPWVTDKLLSLINYKNKLLKCRRKNRDNKCLVEQIKRISKIIKISNKNLMNNYYKNKLQACNGNSKKMWRFLNNELGRKNQSIKSLITEEGILLSTDDEKAVALNKYFYDIVNNRKNSDSDDINLFQTLIPTGTSFTLHAVDNHNVERILRSLKNGSPGSDGITAKMLNKGMGSVVDILVNIFNKMILEGVYPNILKIHKIIPIPKEASSNKIDNLRPISVLSVVDKIFEKLIFEQFSVYLEDNSILFDRQFGFKKGVGTEEALVNVVDFICGELDAGFNGVAGVFYDYSKAFDLVDHSILIRKLQTIGVTQVTLLLFKDYLSYRTQFVQIGRAKSEILTVNCGVPQGSVLGPLLFKIFINDIKNINFKGKMFMYADDICIFYSYKHPLVLKTNIEYDASILTKFSSINKLVINPGKTKFVRFKPYNLTNVENMVVNIGGIPVVESDTVKYLGVILSNNLL